MTNAELLAKIKAEIERLIDERYNWEEDNSSESVAACEALTRVLSFLDTIESETPMNLEGLEEEIERILKCEKEFMNFKFKSQLIGYIARHFAQWGAEHLADASKTSPKDLEEAAKECNSNLQLQEYFIKGGMWQKEQMMKEAVEIGTTEICWVPDGDRVFPTFDPPVEDLLMPGIISQRFKDGDKVRIIIVREDEK